MGKISVQEGGIMRTAQQKSISLSDFFVLFFEPISFIYVNFISLVVINKSWGYFWRIQFRYPGAIVWLFVSFKKQMDALKTLLYFITKEWNKNIWDVSIKTDIKSDRQSTAFQEKDNEVFYWKSCINEN